MPFAPLEAPSLALAQLKAALEAAHGGRVAVTIHHLHHEFLGFTGGVEAYQRFGSAHGRLSGVADWFFRQAAFPDADDNTGAFLDRFYFEAADAEAGAMRAFLADRRPQLEAFLDRLIERHRLHEAAVVGFTCLFHQTMASFALARRIKRRNPGVVVVAGGAACEHDMGREFARRIQQLDHVFSGPALVSFPEFVGRLLAGDRAGCTRIDGVFCRANAGPDGAAVGPLGAELDIDRDLPLDHGGFLASFERHVPPGRLAPMLPFETSRGCSWGQRRACSFCGLNGMTMRHRVMAPERALARIRALHRHAPRCRFFLAVDTLVPETYFEHVFPSLTPPPGTAIMYQARPVLTARQLKLLCRAGVLVVQAGIEALSTATLRLMRKGTTAPGNLLFLRRCSRLPLRVEWNLLVGSPGEPEETLAGALEPHEFYHYCWPLPAEAVRNIACHFVDRHADPDRLNRWLDRLNAAVARWHARHHGHDGHPPARLELAGDAGAPVLLDSRDGTPRRLPLAPEAAALLAFLAHPRHRAEIDARCGRDAAARLLASLRPLGVLFEEGDAVLSLAG